VAGEQNTAPRRMLLDYGRSGRLLFGIHSSHLNSGPTSGDCNQTSGTGKSKLELGS
jgi:hypothetical protein